MAIYYRIWVDCIARAKSIPANKSNWKFFTLLFMSMAMAIDFAVLMSFVQKVLLGSYFFKLNVDLFQGTKIDALISGLMLFVLPMIILNYILIFRNNRFEHLVLKYKSFNGRLFFLFFFGSLLIPFLVFLILFQLN